jgi:phage terminase Nu1 subunit (DNA packaging protein)
VLETSRRAEADREEREVRVRLAEREVEAVAADRWRTKEAEEAFGKVERDLGLITPIEEARHRLAAAQAENAELVQARKNVDALTRTFAAPPEPLRSTSPDL